MPIHAALVLRLLNLMKIRQGRAFFLSALCKQVTIDCDSFEPPALPLAMKGDCSVLKNSLSEPKDKFFSSFVHFMP